MTASGRCSRRTPKIVGKIPPEPTKEGGRSNFHGIQSLEVTPCRSGPAPMIIEAQFGLLELGITARAFRVEAPVFLNRFRFGVRALTRAAEPRPSTPMTTTCSTPGRPGAP